jgi:cytochrome c-type biogenesis protein CcmE
MNPKYKRLIILILILSTLGLATKLVLMALNENIIYFYTPNELKKKYGNVKNIDNKINNFCMTFVYINCTTEITSR